MAGEKTMVDLWYVRQSDRRSYEALLSGMNNHRLVQPLEVVIAETFTHESWSTYFF